MIDRAKHEEALNELYAKYGKAVREFGRTKKFLDDLNQAIVKLEQILTSTTNEKEGSDA